MVDSAKHTEAEKSALLLEETFYIQSKKNTVFKVRLTEKGLSLRKECNGATTKEQTICMDDIIGCKCMRSRRRRNAGASCVCTRSPKSSESFKVVDENSLEGDETDSSAYLYIYAYTLKRRKRGISNSSRERTSITLRFRSFDKYEDNNKEAQKWRYALKCLVRGMSPSLDIVDPIDNRKVLILLNPKSGPGKAREFFQKRVAPVLAEAEIPYDLHVTRRADDARDMIRRRFLNPNMRHQWRCIATVGGDGLCYEVVNGMFEREDWRDVTNAVPLAIIPCGSGNGLARTICHLYDEPYSPKPVLGATLAIVKGRSAPMDLVRVETTNKIMYSFLSVGWGLLADIDIESERLRAIGAQRFTIWSLLRLATLRTYKGTVSYLPISKEVLEKRGLLNDVNSISQNLKIDDSDDSIQANNDWPFLDLNSSTGSTCAACGGTSAGTCDLCDSGFGDAISLETESPPRANGQQQRNTETESYMEGRQRLDSWYSTTSRRSTYYSAAGVSTYHSVDGDTLCGDSSTLSGTEGTPVMMHGPASRIPALTAKVPDEWVTLKGDFVLVHANYQPFIGADCLIAPKSTLDDGIIWLCIIRAGVSRQRLLTFLLGLSSGTHVDSKNFTNLCEITNVQDPYVTMSAVSAFRITPDDTTRGHVTVDGENVPCGPVQGEVFPSLVRMVVP
uniref:Putative sphingosine kinase involved in sphingolipid metabolism n=1 Tax=Xenopsylla cheopis TaxID=163159 RepID=A0A6M2DP90_XENCH